MKTKNLFFAAALSLLTFSACNNDDDAGGAGNQTSPQFTSTIINTSSASTETRAAGSVWDRNDAIGIYMIKSGQGLTATATLAQNKHYITENGTSTGVFSPANANATIHYPIDGSKVDFIAYYPYNTNLTTDYKYPIDVSVQTSQPAIDFLYSNSALNLDKSIPNISLGFKHKLTKIVFAISSGDISDLSGLSITIKGTKTKADFNLAGGENALSVDENSVADISANTSTTGVSGEAIILPETGVGQRTFVFSLPSGESHTWQIPDTYIFEKGMKYTYNVQLQKSGAIKIDPNNTTIEDWTEAPGQTIIPEENKEDGATIGVVELDKLYGYAEGTTGGEGGIVYHFNDGKKFRDWLKLREKNKSTVPAIVWLSGLFTKEDGRDSGSPWFDIKRTSNLSIYGTNSFKMQNVGFFINESENIIIRNIYIAQPKADNGADGISMQESSKIWIDHCTFESENQVKDYEDGSCDITHGTNKVTISWSRFIKTQKTCLVGHSDSQTGDAAITATFHHNFFDRSSSRHPRVRYGTVHVYNNFFNQVSTYGVGSAYGAMVLVENNAFDGVHLPTDICTYPSKASGSNLNGKIAGFLYAADNEYKNIPSNASNPYPFTNIEFKAYQGETLSSPLSRADFVPSYTYLVDKAEDISTKVQTGAGVGKLTNYADAPIPVDNGGMPSIGEPEEPGDGEGSEIGGGWTAINMGDDAASGINTLNADKSSITMAGKGKFESGKQTFNYVYREVTGNFEMTVQLDSYSLSSTSNQAEAGLIFTPNINASATDFTFAMSAKGGDLKCNYSHRLTTGTNSSRGGLPFTSITEGSVYLKLKREGDKYFASYSLDGGITYSAEKSEIFTTSLPDKLYVGLAVNSASNTETATAKFSNIKINGTAVTFQ